MTMRAIEIIAHWAWETSLSASILIVLAFLVRRLVSPNLRHLFGLVILIRLLLPFSPESSLSIFNIFPQQTFIQPSLELSPPLAQGPIAQAPANLFVPKRKFTNANALPFI